MDSNRNIQKGPMDGANDTERDGWMKVWIDREVDGCEGWRSG